MPLQTHDPHGALRRWALFLSILISGGLMLFPREPMVLAVIVLSLVATRWRLPSRRQMWPLFLLLAAVLAVTLLRPGPVSLASLVSRFAHFVAAMLLLNAYLRAPAHALARDLQPILRWMAIQAIATVLLAHTLGFLFIPLSVAGQDYQTLLLLFNYHITIEDIGGLIRPDGFFFEPGVFQIYLNLYLYLVLFIFRRPRQAALAALAVISTQSTTGVLICVILLGASLLHHLRSGSLRGKSVAVLVALVVAPPVLYLSYGNVAEKLYGTAQGSSWAREYDFFTGLNVIAEHPWMGIGFDVNRYLDVSGRLAYEDTLLDSQVTDDRPTTNSLIHLVYCLGVPLALPFVAGMFRQGLFRHRGLIGLWLAMSLFGEAILFTPFFMLIIFSAFVARPATRSSRVRLDRSAAA